MAHSHAVHLSVGTLLSWRTVCGYRCLVNDCYRTDVVLTHAPRAIALAALFTAGVLLDVPIRRWVAAAADAAADVEEVGPAQIESVAASLHALYRDECVADGAPALRSAERTAVVARLAAHWASRRPPTPTTTPLATGAAAARPLRRAVSR